MNCEIISVYCALTPTSHGAWNHRNQCAECPGGITMRQFGLSVGLLLGQSMPHLWHAISRPHDFLPNLHFAVTPRPVLSARQLPRLALIVATDPLQTLGLHRTRLASILIHFLCWVMLTLLPSEDFYVAFNFIAVDPVALLPH